MGYVNTGMGASAPLRPVLPPRPVVRKLAKIVPQIVETSAAAPKGVLSKKVDPSRVGFLAGYDYGDVAGGGLGYLPIPVVDPYTAVAAVGALAFQFGGKVFKSVFGKKKKHKSRMMHQQYMSEWNAMKRRVAAAIAETQPKLDKLNKMDRSFKNQLSALQSQAEGSNSQTVIDALDGVRAARDELGRMISEISEQIDSVNAKSRVVFEAEAGPQTPVDGKPIIGPGGLAEEALKDAVTIIGKFAQEVPAAEKRANALKNVINSATRIVNREAQNVLDQAAQLQAQQMQQDYVAQMAQQQMSAPSYPYPLPPMPQAGVYGMRLFDLKKGT